MEKKCKKCEQVKSLEEFYNDKNTKDSKSFYCKLCTKEGRKIHGKKYYQKHKEKLNAKSKLYFKKNRESMLEHGKEYRVKNKEKLSEERKEYYNLNKDKFAERAKTYRKKNKKQRNRYAREYIQKNELARLKQNIRCTINQSFKNKGLTNNKTYLEILECDFDFLTEWLNNEASNGNIYGIGNLQIDHVIPISLAITEEETALLNHYSNLQLLTRQENQSKSNRYANPINVKRVLENHPTPTTIKSIIDRPFTKKITFRPVTYFNIV
jgi:5-methylcytosine-specific restriction endonuclease McrA